MAVHVDEIHTTVSAAASGQDSGHSSVHQAGQGGEQPTGAPGALGAGEDSWRRTRARVARLADRVAAVDFDD